ncbi:hypothetical protein GCM10022224_066810 [Nonomuraea antimicrobica]|uniref:SseB protein N-terminal domain-containing protein n=1 Tax=Nonomuraea antimicrobica TaxID=561173 RepID=A0ABP7CMX2_9ACTN
MLPPPSLTDELRAAARDRPSQWLYVVDPYFDADGHVPPYGVVGAWHADERGEITGEFRSNPGYRPSPEAMGYPEPTDPLDLAIQLGSADYLDGESIAALFLRSEILVGAGENGAIPVLHDDDGRGLVLTYSHEGHLPDTRQEWQSMLGGELAKLLPADVDVAVNASSAAGVHLPRDGFEPLDQPGQSGGAAERPIAL